MTRDPGTGALAFAACLGAAGCTERAGGPIGDEMVLSPDAEHLYVAAGSGVSLFARNATTGALAFVRSTPGRGLDHATDIAISPGGEDVYVAGRAGALVRFRRNAATGVLGQPAGTTGCITRDGSDGCATGRLPQYESSVHVSPDGTGVYAIGEGGASSATGMLAVLRRDTATGALAQPAGTAGCISQPAQDGCAVHTGLAQARHLAVSPDGADLYVSSGAKPALTQFRRNRATSTLAPGACHVPRSLGTCSSPLQPAGGTAVAVGPDGRNVYFLARYVVGHRPVPGGSGTEYGLLAAYARNTTSGALTQLSGLPGCFTETGARGCRDGRRIDAGHWAASQLVTSPDGRFLYTRTTGFRRAP